MGYGGMGPWCYQAFGLSGFRALAALVRGGGRVEVGGRPPFKLSFTHLLRQRVGPFGRQPKLAKFTELAKRAELAKLAELLKTCPMSTNLPNLALDLCQRISSNGSTNRSVN